MLREASLRLQDTSRGFRMLSKARLPSNQAAKQPSISSSQAARQPSSQPARQPASQPGSQRGQKCPDSRQSRNCRVDKRELKEKTTFSSGRPNSDFQGPAPGPGPEIAQGGRSSLQFCNSETWPSLAHESSGGETHQGANHTIK